MSQPSAINVGSRLSIMMFLQFFVWGAWFATVGNYMGAVGLAEVRPWAYSVGPLAAIIAPVFLGLIADRFFATERVLGIMHIFGGVVIMAAPMAGQNHPWVFIGILAAHNLCYMPTLGLANTLAFHNLTNQEKQFPLIRVFGTLGWIAAGTMVSKLLHADTSPLQFYIAGGAGLLLGVFSFTLPHTPPPAKGKTRTITEVFGLGALNLLKRPSFVIFIVCSLLICIPLSAYYAYAPIFIRANRVSAAWFDNSGFVMSFGQWTEVLFMVLMPLFFLRLGVKWMLFGGMLAWVARYGLFSYAAPDNLWFLILIGVLLHGICYDFFFVTGQIYVDKIAPIKIRAQAQSFLVIMTLGVGLFFGAQIAGVIVEKYTPSEAVEQRDEAKGLRDQADALVTRAESLPEAEADPLKKQATELETQAGEKDFKADTLCDWRKIWLIPTIGAGIIMILFALLFRDDTRNRKEEDDEVEPESEETDTATPE